MAQNMKRGRNQRRRQSPNVNRAHDSTGPDVKIRGTALQIHDKYQALARDAASAGDRVRAESLLQHAEHYFRVMKAMQPPQQQNDPGEEPQPSVSDADGNDDTNDGKKSGQKQQRQDRRKPRNESERGGKDNEGDDSAEEAVAASQNKGGQDAPSGDNPSDDGAEPAESAQSGDGEEGEDKPRKRRRRAPRKSVEASDDTGADDESGDKPSKGSEEKVEVAAE